MPDPASVDKAEELLRRGKTLTEFLESLRSRRLFTFLILMLLDIALIYMRLSITVSFPGEIFWILALLHGVGAIYICGQTWVDIKGTTPTNGSTVP